ncbi:MFS transporter [Brucella gallinifaecis]|uniref:MFS transporter n=1 Tax=Brucella gallinifaecis TaxID=215590 RepID=A0A502BP46_9HYPH|nr:MFS transporter [Brucella gallinifaecis]TPF75610.1 MFS transporter [Brucella gallinifaecis]
MLPQNRWLILAIVSSALFLIVVDMTVLYTALPRLTHDLAASASEKLWIMNIYPLVVAGLLPGLGTLGDKLGHKRMFMSGLVVFGIASLCAAYAPNPEILIAARALLACGAAMMMPATLSIIRLTFTDEKERSLAIGIWAAIASGGAAIGPVAGGILLEYFWWGSVFLINVPIVLIALALSAFALENRPLGSKRKWDLIGSIQIMIGLIALTYAIKELAKRDASMWVFAAALLIGLIATTIFVRRQFSSKEPLIDFSLFSNKLFSMGVFAALVASGAMTGMELVFSQRMQLIEGMSPLQAGLVILPIPLAAFVAGPLAGMMLPRLGTGKVLWASLGITAFGVVLYILTYKLSSHFYLTGLAILGFGVGCAMTGASSSIMSNAPAAKAGMAASVEEVSFELGNALGVTIFGSILSAFYKASLILPAGSNIPSAARDSLDEALLAAQSMPVADANILSTLASQAFEHAYMAVIIATAGLLLISTVAAYIIQRRNIF